jgi:hypothetical protein
MATIKGFLRQIERSQAFINEPSKSEVRDAFVTVARQGWYLGPGMVPAAIVQAARAVQAGDEIAVDERFVRYYEENVRELVQQLSLWHPARISIINKAVDAHLREEYELSVPVFLAQSDGISQELTGFKLFAKRRVQDKKREPETAAFVRKFKGGPFRRALIEPFQHLLPITASEAKRRKANNQLNRHAILHGTSLDYGTRVNSAKAFALLYYVAWVLRPYSPVAGQD